MDNHYINYFEESEKYRPTKRIETLLIAEAPPPSGTRYFYVPKAMSTKIPTENDRSLAATIFYHYFQKRPQSKEEYLELLKNLKDMGIFLMDIMDMPIRIREAKGGINQENLRVLKNEIPKLLIVKMRQRCQENQDHFGAFLHIEKTLKINGWTAIDIQFFSIF